MLETCGNTITYLVKSPCLIPINVSHMIHELQTTNKGISYFFQCEKISKFALLTKFCIVILKQEVNK